VTRGELGKIFGKEISRDLIGDLRGQGLIAAGPRSPQPGAPYTYVTTDGFLSRFGFNSLRDLPDYEKLEDAGLLSKERLLTGDIPLAGLGESDADDGSGDGADDESDDVVPKHAKLTDGAGDNKAPSE